MMVDSLFKEEGHLWKQCYSVCCDDVPAMLGARHGSTARVQQENPSVVIVHCLLHRENLASRKLSHELKKVMQDVFQVGISLKPELSTHGYLLKCALILDLNTYTNLPLQSD